MGLRKRGWGVSSYQVYIGSDLVKIDVRFVGDNYYDPVWAHNIISTRVLNENSIPIPDGENYFYSLLLHALLHKKNISKKYMRQLKIHSTSFFCKEEDINELLLLKYLVGFLKFNGYRVCKPLDSEVYLNDYYLKKLPLELVGPLRFKKPLWVYVYKLSPNWLSFVLGRSLKSTIKKTLEVFDGFCRR
jgi:hypothetical protein